MTIYFLNFKGCSQASAASLRCFLAKYAAIEITDESPLPSSPEGLLFVHGMSQDNMESIARNIPALHIIGVSSEPGTISPPDGSLSNLHKCRHSTLRLKGSPVERFLDAYIKKCDVLSWQEIEPLKSIDNLIALYLLELSALETEEIKKMKKKVLLEAKMEYSKIEGADSELPHEHDKRLSALRKALNSEVLKCS